jgi:hypothetical protein
MLRIIAGTRRRRQENFRQIRAAPRILVTTTKLREVAVRYALCVLAVVLARPAWADEPAQSTADKQALAPLQAYVGQWRGVGQLKRGSTRGAWTEQSQWSWHFEKGRAELVGDVSDGKYFRQLRVRPGEKPVEFVVLAAPVEGGEAAQPRRFAGELADGVLQVTAAEAASGEPARIAIRLVAGGDRMAVLYEKRLGADSFARLAEVGATRQGSSFAKNAASGPECVVTGGLGEIAVEHNGKTYYVCCTGCRDLFLEDPDGVLAEYRARKEAERAKKANLQ